MTATRIAEMDVADRLVLVDVRPGVAQGIAIDLGHAAPLEGFRTEVTASESFDATAGSDVVILAAGVPRTLAQDYVHLGNGELVADISREVATSSPGAVIVVLERPVAIMTALAHEVSGFPAARVMGQSGIAQSARFSLALARELGVPQEEVDAVALATYDGLAIPLVSRATVGGRPLREVATDEQIERCAEAARQGAMDIVRQLGTGGPVIAPSVGVARMTRLLLEDRGEVYPVCTRVDDAYELDEACVGVLARLGAGGVTEIVGLEIDEAERLALHETSQAIEAKLEELSAVRFRA